MDFNVNELSLSQLLDLKKKIVDRLESEFQFNEVMAFANSWILKTGNDDYVEACHVYTNTIELYTKAKPEMEAQEKHMQANPILRVYENIDCISIED